MSAEPLPEFLAGSPAIGDEISVTGKWVPSRKGGLFRRSPDSMEMIQEWEDIHAEARQDPGVLSTEINHAIGEEAILVHHLFRDSDALEQYFASTATDHAKALLTVARPELHLVRGVAIPDSSRRAILAKQVPTRFGEWKFGYARNNNRRPDPQTAIQVTAQWSCKSESPGDLDQLLHWWQCVGTDAHSMEAGLLRFETYQVSGEDALIIHETFEDTKELKFHLTKGTADKYKKDIDEIAAPECYYFRGPVSWTIRTYSKFMRLPATYSSQGSTYTQSGGNLSNGIDS
jgi:quinol monooxygenase YgiN